MSTTLKCAHCGGDLGPGDGFCAHCGAPAGEGEPAWTDLVERLRRATLGEFELGRELGRGGMAAVFLAHEISLDRKVAIKVMSPGLLLGDGMVDRFRHEAVTVASLHHPNIVSVYSVRQAEGLHFFVMQYVQGRSLDQVIGQAGRLPLPMVRSILHQVGSALTYAHRHRVIHRDIKPGNILIDGDGNAIVTDFGIAKAAESPNQTLTGALLGTPAYMSPEQCRGGEVSGASDQYALGAVAYEMLTGSPPFSGSTYTVLQAHVERPPVPPSERLADCPAEVEAAILRMLAKDPAARWPRIADAMAALGAEPLADDSPLRIELSQLVAAGGAPARPRLSHATTPHTSGRKPAGIAILPPPPDLEVGDSFVLVAMVRGPNGTRLPPGEVTWSAEPAGVLKLESGGGVAVAIGAGSTLLGVACKGVRAELQVEVAAPRADEIIIDPPEHGVRAGEEIHLEASARDKRGRPVGRPVSWQSADPAIATVTATGGLIAQSPGMARITAVLDAVRATVTVPVLPARVAALRIGDPPPARAGATLTLTATPVDRWGGPLGGRTVLWSSSDVRIAVVAAGGTVHALRPGPVVLTASCEGISESVKLNIGLAQPAAAPPAEPQPMIHRRLRRRRRGRLLAGMLGAGIAVAVVWLLDRVEPPTVSAALPQPAGYVSYRDSSDSIGAASVAITKQPGRPLRPGRSFQLAAEVRDPEGHRVPGAGVVWASSDSTVARVDPESGWVRAIRPGRVQVVATSGEARDSTPVVVRLGVPVRTVGSVSIQPVERIHVGESATLQALVLDTRGEALADSAVAWHSSDVSVATIDSATGLLSALAPGNAVIVARSGGESAVLELPVLPVAVADVIVHGTPPLMVGQEVTLRAIPTDARGNSLTDRAVVWMSSDPGVLEVDEATGRIVARSPGSVDVTATSEGRSGRVRLTVFARDIVGTP